ncbi:MAG: glutathione S-transferase N-terminal domain-containing protein [Desulfocapsaceae bacterium]|nr:glutathione S-transferase N-terminal domain-containing protein [Desulfocapsaceae bacterium]
MIQLYLWANCPFCQKVVRAASDMGLKEGVDYAEIDGAPGTPGREVVEKTGGKAMVPFLIDGDVHMYESDDIIDYLRNKAGR